MSPDTLTPEALAQYHELQHAVRAAIDRCADDLSPQVVPCPSTPDDPTTPLVFVLRAMLRGHDYPQIGQRLLMVLAEAGRHGDAVALFAIERMATFYAAQQMVALADLAAAEGQDHAA